MTTSVIRRDSNVLFLSDVMDFTVMPAITQSIVPVAIELYEQRGEFGRALPNLHECFYHSIERNFFSFFFFHRTHPKKMMNNVTKATFPCL